MVFYQNRVRNRFSSNNNLYGGGVRKIYTSILSGLNNNKYIVGSNVGGLNASVRRALIRRASNNSKQTCCSSSSAPPATHLRVEGVRTHRQQQLQRKV